LAPKPSKHGSDLWPPSPPAGRRTSSSRPSGQTASRVAGAQHLARGAVPVEWLPLPLLRHWRQTAAAAAAANLLPPSTTTPVTMAA